ncbi:hypothetical protein [Dyella solisilvae]|nr:hypothetical protein [Dyella solisilvae]
MTQSTEIGVMAATLLRAIQLRRWSATVSQRAVAVREDERRAVTR